MLKIVSQFIGVAAVGLYLLSFQLKRRRQIVWVTCASNVLYVLQHNWIELIPIGGALLQTGSLWFENEQTIRKFALAGAPFWLAYNFISQAYGAALGSVLTILSTVIALVRYREEKNPR